MRCLLLILALVGPPASAALITVDAANYTQGTDISTISPGATFSTYTNIGAPGGHFTPVHVVQNRWGSDIAPNAFGHGLLGLPQPPGSSQAAVEWNFHNIWRGAEECLIYGNCIGTNEVFYALHVAFDTPTDYVGVNVHYDRESIDGSILRAFDIAGNVIATCRVWGAGQAGTDRDPQSGLFPTATSPNCGDRYRRYDCSRTGVPCASDFTAFISTPGVNIAFVMWGSESESATQSTISSLTYRGVPEPATLSLLLAGLAGVFVIRRKA